MEDIYLGWVEQLETGLRSWGSVKVEGKYRLVVVSGMGGSGIIGDYVSVLSSVYGGLPVIVSKSHLLPQHVSSNDLVFIVSYSGNTLETRIAYREALRRGARVVVVSSDGLLEEYAGRDGVAFVRIIKGIVPRTALPHMLYSVLGVLDSSGYTIVSRNDAEHTYVFMRDNMRHAVEEAYRIASFIAENKGLLILATHTPFEPLILRGKNEFNENSKIPVKVEAAPEWMHNDIVGWEKPFRNKYSVVTVCDGDDRVGSRLIGFMEDVYRGLDIPVYRFVLRGESFLDKLLYGSLVFGLASVKLARIRGLDPMATETIRKYKEAAPGIFSGFES